MSEPTGETPHGETLEDAVKRVLATKRERRIRNAHLPFEQKFDIAIRWARVQASFKFQPR